MQLIIGRLNRIKGNILYIQVPSSTSPTEKSTFEYTLHKDFIDRTQHHKITSFKPGTFLKIIYNNEQNYGYPIKTIDKLTKKPYRPFQQIKLTYKEI